MHIHDGACRQPMLYGGADVWRFPPSILSIGRPSWGRGVGRMFSLIVGRGTHVLFDTTERGALAYGADAGRARRGEQMCGRVMRGRAGERGEHEERMVGRGAGATAKAVPSMAVAWLGMVGIRLRAHREPGRHTPLCVANQIKSWHNCCPAAGLHDLEPPNSRPPPLGSPAPLARSQCSTVTPTSWVGRRPPHQQWAQRRQSQSPVAQRGHHRDGRLCGLCGGAAHESGGAREAPAGQEAGVR